MAEQLHKQGLDFPAIPSSALNGDPRPGTGLVPNLAREALKEALADRGAIRLLKWCALIHDVGKPGTRIVDKEGHVHFHGHPEYGLQLLSRHLIHLFPPECRQGCDLRLLASMNDVGGLPTAGKSLVVVTVVDQVLHVRIFDEHGTMVVDTNATRPTDDALPIEDLRKQLESLWPPHEPTESEKVRVIAAVASIAGHTHRRRLHPLVHRQHDHKNLAASRPGAPRPGLLEAILDDPWKAAAEDRFRDAWAECRRDPLPRRRWGRPDSASTLEGADATFRCSCCTASPTVWRAGQRCIRRLIEARLLRLYLEFLAVWQRSSDLLTVAASLAAAPVASGSRRKRLTRPSGHCFNNTA